MVPDHWAPIAILARQRGWTRAEAARAAAGAGMGHTLSTLAIALLVWFAGAALANRVGHLASILSSLALIGFGGWIAFGAWRELRGESDGHAHGPRDHDHDHDHDRDDAKGGAAKGPSQRTALLLILARRR